MRRAATRGEAPAESRSRKPYEPKVATGDAGLPFVAEPQS
jgi:hypothetical protein